MSDVQQLQPQQQQHCCARTHTRRLIDTFLWLCPRSCRIPWPASTAPRAYPDPLHQLVCFCLEVDPARRPSVPQVLQRVDDLLAQQL